MGIVVAFAAACFGISESAQATSRGSKVPQSKGYPAVSGFSTAAT